MSEAVRPVPTASPDELRWGAWKLIGIGAVTLLVSVTVIYAMASLLGE